MKKLIWIGLLILGSITSKGAELFVGRASMDITPDVPVALMGQFHLRIANEVNTPLSANIIALVRRTLSS